MHLQHLRDFLVGFLSWNQRKDDQSNSAPVVCEQSRLIDTLKCTHLDDEEVKYLEAYLTTILEARNHDKTSDLAAINQSGSLMLEMGEEEFQEFASCVEENSLCLFRVTVESSNSKTQRRKLAILGEHGMRLFRVLVRSGSSSLNR